MAYKRGKIWYACVYDPIEGKHIRESSKSTKKADAEKLEEGIRKRLEDAQKKKGYVSFSQAMLAYIEQHFPKLREKTRYDYMQYIKTIDDYFSAMYVQEITAKEAAAFKNWMLLSKGMTERSVTLRVRCLSSFLSFCAEMQIIERNPLIGVNMKLPASNVRSRVLSHDEQKKLIENATGETLTFLLLCLECGLRHTEALSVREGDIDFKNNVLNVSDGKGGKSRVVPMTKAVHAHLRAHNFKGEFLFCNDAGDRQKSKKTAWKALLKRSEIEEARIHDLRRTYGSNLRDKGVAMHTISALMGHSGTAITERVYAKAQDRELRNAVDMLDTPHAQIAHINQLTKKG